MSFRRLLDRTVTLIPRAISGQNARGNDTFEDGDPIPNVRTARDLLDATEDTGNTREQQRERFVYFFDRDTPIDGFSKIVDVDGVFEVEGTPDRIARRRGGREHHVEAIAYKSLG